MIARAFQLLVYAQDLADFSKTKTEDLFLKSFEKEHEGNMKLSGKASAITKILCNQIFMLLDFTIELSI